MDEEVGSRHSWLTERDGLVGWFGLVVFGHTLGPRAVRCRTVNSPLKEICRPSSISCVLGVSIVFR